MGVGCCHANHTAEAPPLQQRLRCVGRSSERGDSFAPLLVAPRPPSGEDAPRQTGKAKDQVSIFAPVTVRTAGEGLEGLLRDTDPARG